FCATVMCGNSAYSWKTVLTSRWRAGSKVTSTPPSLITPAVGCSNPAIIRNTVVLPEPDGPRIANSSPSPTARSAPSTAPILFRESPNTLRTLTSSICGSSTGAATFVSDCGLAVPEGMAHRRNSTVMAQLHCGYRDLGPIRPLVSHMVERQPADTMNIFAALRGHPRVEVLR